MLLELSTFGQFVLLEARKADYEALKAKGPTLALAHFEALFVINGEVVGPRYVEHYRPVYHDPMLQSELLKAGW